MSDAPRSPRLRPPSTVWFKTRRRLAGLVFLALLALLAGISVAAYNKEFASDTMVTLYTDAVGNEMNINADVSVRGVVVGQVRSITSDGSGARLELSINPATAASLPANVTAEMLPTTLFGERYVDLILPARPQAQTLAQTRIVEQDRSADAVELETVLNDMLPMLTAIQPQKLSVTLTAIADTLQNRGATLGQTLVVVNAYLKQFNPQLPALDNDISELVQVTQTYAQAAPGIVAALRDFSVTSQTVASEAANLDSLYSVVTGASQNLTAFLNENKQNLIELSGDGKQPLQILQRYSAEFPCVLQQLTDFIPNIDKVLGAGTKQPGLHATLHTVPAQEPYKPGVNTPRYGDNTGAECYATPLRGVSLNDGAADVSTAGLGLPNSPQENELVDELAAPEVNVAPDSLPDWSSVLLGPLYRGTTVKIK
ncbi:MAG TPA: MCE family protein [Trebonia sp.]|jgi:phospholipid/cholesterol/gamma-HCH transport system substrate-binding protein|nr:MCE family protein [Trebonia sp.]